MRWGLLVLIKAFFAADRYIRYISGPMGRAGRSLRPRRPAPGVLRSLRPAAFESGS